MNISIKTYVLLLANLLLPFCLSAEPLSLERLEEIIASEHDDTALPAELQVYPKARQYDIEVTLSTPEGKEFRAKARANEKWVAGKYIVSEILPEGPGPKYLMVVEYDRSESVYKKYVMHSGAINGYQVGTRIPNTRCISWIDLSPSKIGANIDNLTIDTHSDLKTTWRSIYFRDGLIERLEMGVASVVK